MKSFLLACIAALVACGGATTGPLLGDGGTDGSDGASSTDGAGSQCDTLLAQLNAQEPQAETCCPTCNVTPCGQLVDGLCCPLTVTSGDSPEVKGYEATLKAFHDAQCNAACPAISCATAPSGHCNGTGETGACVQ